MKLKSFFAVALAAIAMTACNKEVEGPNGPEQGGGEEITPTTYAVFALKLDDGGMRAVGTENSIQNEAAILNAGIYIFRNDGTGKSEQMKSVSQGELTPGDPAKIPTIAMATGAGKKHIVVVTNMTPHVAKALETAFGTPGSTTFEEFHKVYTREVMGTNTATDPRDNVLIKTGDVVDAIMMTGMIETELENGVSATEAAAGGKNNLKITVDRAIAKFDMKLATDGANDMAVDQKVEIGGTDTPVGKVQDWTYAMRNIAWEQYVRQQKEIGEFIATPGSDMSLTPASLRPMFSEANDTYKYLLAHNADYNTNKAFIMENTNDVARVHNSTYAAVKATYVPNPSLYVMGINNATDGETPQVAWVQETAAIAADQYSLFCFEKNVAFKTVSSKTVSADNFRATAIMNFAADPAYKDLGLENALIIKAGALETTTGDGVIDLGPWTGDITDAANIKKITDYLDGITIDPYPYKSRLVISYVTKSAATDVAKYTMKSIVVSKVGDAGYTHNNNVAVATATFGFYKTAALGLQCYYRINVFDNAFGPSHKMYNSVLRNNSYHTKITKIKTIGFAEEGDMVVKPEEPLNVNTHVQVVVTVNKWVAKQMDTEIGQ